MRYFLFLLVISLVSVSGSGLNAQVSINNDAGSPDASAMLDISSDSRGVLIPRLTIAQRNNIDNPATGLLVYVSNTKSFWLYNGSEWQNLAPDNLGDHIATEHIQLEGYHLTNDGDDDEGISVANDGDVGIGLQSNEVPKARLHLRTETSTGLKYALQLENRNNTFGSAVGLKFGKDNNGGAKGAIAFETTAGWGRGSIHFMQNNDISGATVSLEDTVMTITREGKVGIGTATPDYKFQVAGSLKATSLYGDGSNLTGTGDDLGNHLATSTLNLNSNDITNAGTVNAVTFVGDGSALTGITHSQWAQADTSLYYMEGNVGIGVNSPDSRLQVDGTVTATAFSGDGSGLTNLSNVWSLNGNSGIAQDTQFIGTTDNAALNFRVNNKRALRLEYDQASPNFISGHQNNSVENGVIGATIVGGGKENDPNIVSEDFGTVMGGTDNLVSGQGAVIIGGTNNVASGFWASVIGGASNSATNIGAIVLSGNGNTSSGLRAISGGYENLASGNHSVALGGSSSTVSGFNSMGFGTNILNAGDYSFAAGRKARILASHDGTFLFADNYDLNFNSVAPNEFAVRATGGVRFVTAIDGSGNPTQSMSIDSAGAISATAFIGDGSQLTGIGDDLGNHTAAADINLNNHWLSGGTQNTGLKINSSGYVGIGTPIPTSTLDVDGQIRMRTGAADGYIPVADTNGIMTWTDPGNIFTAPVSIVTDTDGDTRIDVETNPDEDMIRFTTGGTEALVITKNANGDVDMVGSVNANVLMGSNHYDNTGINNTMIGAATGRDNTSGYANTLVGAYAAARNTEGFQNVIIGTAAGDLSTEGNRNVYVGYGAGYDCGGSSNVFIGNYSGAFATNASNRLYIQNRQGDSTQALIYGEFDNELVAINGSLSADEITFPDGSALSSAKGITLVTHNDFSLIDNSHVIQLYINYDAAGATYPSTNDYSTPLIAAVDLPHGAQVTKVTYYGNDASSSRNIAMSLRRSTFLNGGYYTLSSHSSNTSSGTYSYTDESINFATINNNSYRYFISISPVNGNWYSDGSLAVNAIKIEYTMD